MRSPSRHPARSPGSVESVAPTRRTANTGLGGRRSGGVFQRERIASRTRQLPRSSRWLYRADHYTSLPITAPVALIAVVAAVAVGAVLRFSTAWVTGFEIGTSSLTVMMVFVIQHTQGREQAATQRKLDELLRALPEAESGLMMLEEASDEAIRDVEMEQRESKATAR